jgi:GNAT superfamily N-acetyltransferase
VIRELRDSDIPGLRRLLYDVVPETLVGTEETLRHWLASQPARAHFQALVAEEEGEIVGWSEAGFEWYTSAEGAAEVWVIVHPDHRRKGIGGRLAAAVDEHLARIGAKHAETSMREGSVGQAFAERRGYKYDHREFFSAVDPRTVNRDELAALEAEKAAEGFRVAPLEELRERPEELHALDAAVTVDIPAAFVPDDLRYDEWLVGTFAAPGIDWEGSRLVFAGDRPVAMTFLSIDREIRRADNDMTGTLPEFRGRGLARLAKLSALVWAAEHGIDEVATGNDETNVAMLAVNGRLGYKRRAVWVGLIKELDG